MPPSLPRDFFQPVSARKATELAEAWSASIDISKGVGDRHHIVPRFCLDRFSDKSRMIKVRDRSDRPTRKQKTDQFTIKDFYTIVNKNGELDGSFEQIFANIEGRTATVLREVASPYSKGNFGQVAKEVITSFVAFQMVRGQRHRREFELMTDLWAKVMAPDESLGELEDLMVVPHPNEYLKTMGPLAEAIFKELMGWNVFLLDIDHAGLITCDEPVLRYYEHEPAPAHMDTCLADGKGTAVDRETIHVSKAGRYGIADADAILMPLDPRTCLCFSHEINAGERIRMTGDEAIDFASTVRSLAIENAYMFAYSHPAQVYLDTIKLPEITSLLDVCGVDSVRAKISTAKPDRLRPEMLRDRSEHKKGSHGSRDSAVGEP